MDSFTDSSWPELSSLKDAISSAAEYHPGYSTLWPHGPWPTYVSTTSEQSDASKSAAETRTTGRVMTSNGPKETGKSTHTRKMIYRKPETPSAASKISSTRETSRGGQDTSPVSQVTSKTSPVTSESSVPGASQSNVSRASSTRSKSSVSALSRSKETQKASSAVSLSEATRSSSIRQTSRAGQDTSKSSSNLSASKSSSVSTASHSKFSRLSSLVSEAPSRRPFASLSEVSRRSSLSASEAHQLDSRLQFLPLSRLVRVQSVRRTAELLVPL